MYAYRHLNRPRRLLGEIALVFTVAWGLGACTADPTSDLESAGDSDTPSINQVLEPSFTQIWAPFDGDLPGMIDRRIVRVVTPFGGYMYYFDEGEPRGTTWELANRLEAYLNKELGNRNIKVYVVVTPLSRDQLIPALVDGHADIIAADLTVTNLRTEQLAFTRGLLKDVNEIIVAGPSAADIDSLDDLAGRKIHVRRSSSYFEHLERLGSSMRQRDLEPPTVIALDELLESEDILEMIHAGMIGMTVMDDYKANLWASVFEDINVRDDLIVNEGGVIAWAVRKDNPQLLQKLNAFLRKYGRGTLLGNDTYNRYLADADALRCGGLMAKGDRLPDMADTFRKYAQDYDFEWLQLAAQAYQESRLRQDTRSPAGAVGVMQIRPSTATDPNVGIDDISTLDGNVHAGAKYMRFLTDRYFADDSINELDRWLLSLAAYNAGPARVINLRNEAARVGYDPDKWFNNVEIIAAKRIGRETVTYVSNIFKYYTSYQMASAKVAQSQQRFGDLLSSCESG